MPSQPAERAFIVCHADHGQSVACHEPPVARGWRVVCVVGRDFQSQSGRAFPGGCRGGISIESDRGVAGLCRHTEADAVDRNLNDASKFNPTCAYSTGLDDAPDEHRTSERNNRANPPVVFGGGCSLGRTGLHQKLPADREKYRELGRELNGRLLASFRHREEPPL